MNTAADKRRQRRAPECAICGERMPNGPEAEMYDPAGPRSGFCHAECGLQAGWEVA